MLQRSAGPSLRIRGDGVPPVRPRAPFLSLLLKMP